MLILTIGITVFIIGVFLYYYFKQEEQITYKWVPEVIKEFAAQRDLEKLLEERKKVKLHR